MNCLLYFTSLHQLFIVFVKKKRILKLIQEGTIELLRLPCALTGQKVFYPVMFSLYNPEVIYGQHIPSAEDQLVRSPLFSVSCYVTSQTYNSQN